MNKGSLLNFVKGNTSHRFPKVAALAISSCVLVTLVAIDASASGYTPSIAAPATHAGIFAPESSLGQLFGFGRFHRVSVTSGGSTDVTTTTQPTSATASGSGSSGGGGGDGGGSTSTPTATTTTTAPPTTTTTAPPSSPSTSGGGLITAGPSRKECLIATDANDSSSVLQSAIASFQSTTNSTVSCLGSYLNGAQTWSDWSNPWIATADGAPYTSWVAASPNNRELVLQVDLIPHSLENTSDPLSWEQSCAAGDFNSYATQLGNNLVGAGLQNSVIRLGAEANGPWETDFVGTTAQEQSAWASCFDNEVTGLRAASGEHFLIDWNPNSCYENIPFANYYPGNAYVDIMGLDQYDAGCDQPSTQLTFAQLASEPGGLDSFEAFAAAQGKPMSFPEWGLDSSPSGDDPGYINGIGSTVEDGDFAFQEYFDNVTGGTLLIDSGQAPQSSAQYQKWFG